MDGVGPFPGRCSAPKPSSHSAILSSCQRSHAQCRFNMRRVCQLSGPAALPPWGRRVWKGSRFADYRAGLSLRPFIHELLAYCRVGTVSCCPDLRPTVFVFLTAVSSVELSCAEPCKTWPATILC